MFSRVIAASLAGMLCFSMPSLYAYSSNQYVANPAQQVVTPHEIDLNIARPIPVSENDLEPAIFPAFAAVLVRVVVLAVVRASPAVVRASQRVVQATARAVQATQQAARVAYDATNRAAQATYQAAQATARNAREVAVRVVEEAQLARAATEFYAREAARAAVQTARQTAQATRKAAEAAGYLLAGDVITDQIDFRIIGDGGKYMHSQHRQVREEIDLMKL